MATTAYQLAARRVRRWWGTPRPLVAMIRAWWRAACLSLAVCCLVARLLPASERTVLEGVLSIRAALQARRRTIHVLYIRRGKQSEAVARLAGEARAAGARVCMVADEVIQRHAAGRTHGGVIALAGPRTMLSVEDLLVGQPCPFLVLLDGLEDPFNFGHAVRACYAAGVDGVVVRPRDWLAVDGILARSSAGATELLPIAVATSLPETVTSLRAQGLLVACATRGDAATPIYDAHLRGPLLLVVGGEKRGVSRRVLATADVLVQLPYQRPFAQALGLAEATAALVFEIMRQRGAGEQPSPPPPASGTPSPVRGRGGRRGGR